MPKVKIYTTKICPYCVKAKNILERNNLEYEEIDLTEDLDALTELKNRTSWQTVPQIFIDDEFIGGCSELEKLEKEGKLNFI